MSGHHAASSLMTCVMLTSLQIASTLQISARYAYHENGKQLPPTDGRYYEFPIEPSTGNSAPGREAHSRTLKA